MSAATKYFDRPMSFTTDLLVCSAVGAAAFIVAGLVPPLLPFQDALRTGFGGAVAGAAMYRARSNAPLNRPAK